MTNSNTTHMTTADRLYSAVQDVPGMTAAEYAKLLDIEQANISSVIVKLYRNGFLKRDRVDNRYKYHTSKPRKLGTPLPTIPKRSASPASRKKEAAPSARTKEVAAPKPSQPVLITVQGVPMTVAQARIVWTELNQLFAQPEASGC